MNNIFYDIRVAKLCFRVDRKLNVKQEQYKHKEFKSTIGTYRLEDCVWLEIRKIAIETKCYKYALYFLIEMLEQEIYSEKAYNYKAKEALKKISYEDEKYFDYRIKAFSFEKALYNLLPSFKKYFIGKVPSVYYSILFE